MLGLLPITAEADMKICQIGLTLLYEFYSLFWEVGKEKAKFLVEALAFWRLAVSY